MSENKTQKTDASVEDFLTTIEDEGVRSDCRQLIQIMEQIVKAPAAMWGENIVGVGDYHYRYPSGREGDWFLTGFAPRKRNLTLYVTGCIDQFEEEVAKLGIVRCGKGCIYVKRLSDIHIPSLKKLIRASVKELKKASTKPS